MHGPEIEVITKIIAAFREGYVFSSLFFDYDNLKKLTGCVFSFDKNNNIHRGDIYELRGLKECSVEINNSRTVKDLGLIIFTSKEESKEKRNFITRRISVNKTKKVTSCISLPSISRKINFEQDIRPLCSPWSQRLHMPSWNPRTGGSHEISMISKEKHLGNDIEIYVKMNEPDMKIKSIFITGVQTRSSTPTEGRASWPSEQASRSPTWSCPRTHRTT